jgi:hypothetical protein
MRHAPVVKRLVLDDRFDAPVLDPDRWVPHYLPQWSTPELSAARYDLGPDGLRLRVDADQSAWHVDEPGVRVSSLQTATFSGPAGSDRGSHRHRPGLTVVTPQPTRLLCTPTGGRAEVTMRMRPDPTAMLAFWLAGTEVDDPTHAGVLCAVELFGRAIRPDGCEINVGVEAHHDPRLHDDVATLTVPIDATRWHTYGVEWSAHRPGIRFTVDDDVVRQVDQQVPYAMMLFVDLFDLTDGGALDPVLYPKTGDVRRVRVWEEEP